MFVEKGELLFGAGFGGAVQNGQKSSVAGRARPQSLHVFCEVVMSAENDKRSHAGSMASSTARDGLPALADACG